MIGSTRLRSQLHRTPLSNINMALFPILEVMLDEKFKWTASNASNDLGNGKGNFMSFYVWNDTCNWQILKCFVGNFHWAKNFWSLEDRETIEEMGQHENIKPLDSIPAQDIS